MLIELKRIRGKLEPNIVSISHGVGLLEWFLNAMKPLHAIKVLYRLHQYIYIEINKISTTNRQACQQLA
jgi:hypothetical protein